MLTTEFAAGDGDCDQVDKVSAFPSNADIAQKSLSPEWYALATAAENWTSHVVALDQLNMEQFYFE